MAETGSKRSGMGGRAPIPTPRVQQNQNQNQNQTASLAPVDAVLNRIIGAKIRLKLSNIDHDFTGFVINFSTAQQTLSISPTRLGSNAGTANAGANPNGGGGISMISVASIESFQVLELATVTGAAAASSSSSISSSSSSSVVRSALLPMLTNAEVERNVRAARDRALEEVANQGKGVTSEAQELYDALRRTLPVRWANRGGAFIVNENTLVEPPYGPDNCKLADGVEPGPKAERAITVVKRYLEAERKKLADKKSTETALESEKKGG